MTQKIIFITILPMFTFGFGVEKCGFDKPYLDIGRNLTNCTTAIMQKTILSPQGHCYIHFDTTGTDAPDLEDLDMDGIPDYINNVATTADSSYALLVETMNFNDGANGIDNITDIYVIELSGSIYGRARPIDSCFDSCIEIDNDYIEGSYHTHGLTAMQPTLIHEFFHTIQYTYQCSPGSDTYFYELTSTWIEDLGFPESNDYLNFMTQNSSSSNYYFNPEQNFDNTNGYSAAWFGHFLSTQYDAVDGITHLEELESVIMRKIWERIAISGSSALNIVDYILENEYNSSFIEAWVEFNSHNLFNQLDESFYYYQDQALIGPIKPPETIVLENDVYTSYDSLNNKSVDIPSFSIYQPGLLDITVSSVTGNHFGNIAIISDEENYFIPIFNGITEPLTENIKLYFVISTFSSSLTININMEPSYSPLPPENLWALTAPDYVDLWWEPSPGPGDSLWYVIYRNDELLISTTDTLFTDSSVELMTEYEYKIEALNIIGASEIISIVVDTGIPDFPAEPEELLFFPDWDIIELWWKSSTGPGTSITYTINRNNDSLTSVTDTLFMDTTIISGTEYQYDVYSVNRIGNSTQPISVTISSWPSPENIKQSELLSVYPNPLKVKIHSEFTIIIDSDIELDSGTFRLYNILGREINTWRNITLEKGRQRISFDGLSKYPLSSGVYFISYQKTHGKISSIPVMLIH